MEKKAILAIILTFIIIVLWSFIQTKIFPPPAGKPVTQEAKKDAGPVGEKTPEKALSPKPSEIVKEKKPPVAKTTPKKEVFVEAEDYTAVLTSDGARLKEFRLKKYLDRVNESSFAWTIKSWIGGLLGKESREPKSPEPLNLVNTNEEEGFPLRVTFSSSNASLPSGNWEVDKEQVRLIGKDEKGEVSFSGVLENGLKVVKRYSFQSGKEVIGLDVELENTSSQEISTQVGLEWIGRVELKKLAEDEIKDFGLKYSYLKDKKVERKDLGGATSSGCTPGCSSPKTKVEPFELTDKGNIGWFSFGGEYFTALLIPPPSQGTVSLAVKGDERSILRAEISGGSVTVPPGQSAKIPFRIYLGPKEISRLKELGVGGEKLVDFGYFSVVAQPLLWLLNLTHGVTGNYGIDIIILSILIKIIFLPLTQISFKSMKGMQKVQPEMNRLREVYKNDKARLQQEIMLLYKRRRINPLSGCLPMVIQIPVFIALYNVLQNTFEMRHAPFFLWIQDLSAKDPIYFTPLLMGATMVIQQKMTPTAADPAQAKMFMLMPVMFTFLFLSFPSGLVLYWLVTNVLSIAHQYYLNKKT
jgi:YidC/Oxa1 family membrane protein insertase